MDDQRLKVRSLGARYAQTDVFKGLSFDVKGGELLAIMGRSGSGKSTLLRVLSGFVKPCEGTVAIDGQVVTDGPRLAVPAARRGVGLMFQNFALFPHMTVAENVGFGIRGHVNQKARVSELLTAVELKGFESRKIDTLSGGQKQRVALVRALAPKPALLLLDEPFANLDVQIRRPIAEMLIHLLRSTGTSAVMVTHDGREAMSLADKVAILENTPGGAATMSQFGTPEEVYWAPKTSTVAALTGQVIIVDGEGNGNQAQTALGVLPIHPSTHGHVRLMIRPSTLNWAVVEGEPAIVDDAYFCGPGYTLAVRCGDIRFELFNAKHKLEPGTSLRFSLTQPAT
ncbi:MAG: ABC transporter ATP-binding protein, partial [Bradymonadia bacterium]